MKKWLFITQHNLKYWEKSWLKTSLLMIVTAFLVVNIGMLAYSLTRHVETYLYESPGYRSIYVPKMTEQTYSQLMTYKSEHDYITSVSKESWQMLVNVDNVKELTQISVPKEQEAFGKVVLYGNKYIDNRYLTKGRWIENANEVIVPKELTFNTISEDIMKLNVDSFDGENFIGKKIHISYRTFIEEGEKLVPNNTYQETFTVVGVYDNKLAQQSSTALIVDDDLLYDISYKYQQESDPDKEPFIAYNVMVDHSKYVDQTIKDISALLNGEANLFTKTRRGRVLRLLTPFIQTTILASTILFVIGFLIQKSLMSRLFLIRNDEIGTLKVLGYSDAMIRRMFFMEVSIWSGATFMMTMLFSYLFKFAMQVWINHYTSYFLSGMHLIFNVGELVYVFLMLMIMPLFSLLFNLNQLNNIQPIDAISGVVE